ncbi:MAG: sugar phosphate isomerase/epimerase [Planctomycetaceae bacterium]|nr:sugar phosphate isomerase/epimerase [Planctomycetaceae bacterium]
MSSWNVGVFASIDAGLGVQLEVVRDLGIKTIQLHTPSKTSRTAKHAEEFNAKLSAYGITISTVFLGFEGESYESIKITSETVGFVPKATRASRLAEAFQIADFAKLLNVDAIGSHIGFVPHDKTSADYTDVVSTIRQLCEHLKQNGQTLHLETGQEEVTALRDFIGDVGTGNLFVNFDPANLILYGIGNPIGALKTIGQWVRGVHCKDAVATTGVPGVDWGAEVPFGKGQVDAELFLQTLKEVGYTGPLTIEREIPEDPLRQKEEIGQAIELINGIISKL